VLVKGMPAGTYTEERDFTLRIQVRCRFPEDYDGDADGYAWWDDMQPAAAEIVRAAVAILARQPGCRIHPENRGRPTSEEVTLVVERVATV
jgi:hypothetical protein